MRFARSTARWPPVRSPTIPPAFGRWPRHSATRPRSSPRCRPRRTWVCRAATRPRPPISGPARRWWTWGAAAASTCSWRRARSGPTGRAIGIDMTPEMIERARRNAAEVAKQGITNVEFHQAKMEAMPLADDSVDCLISNCVINLAADKSAVFREMFRVLKPGGRVAVSDIALKKELPIELARSVAALVGCVAGALLGGGVRADAEGGRLRGRADRGYEERSERLLEGGGLHPAVAPSNVEVSDRPSGPALPVTEENGSRRARLLRDRERDRRGCCSSGPATVHEGLSEVLGRFKVNEFAASVRVFAVKPIVGLPAVSDRRPIGRDSTACDDGRATAICEARC